MEFCKNCNHMLFEDVHNGISVCTSCGLCGRHVGCLVPDYVPVYDVYCVPFFETLGRELNLSDQYMLEGSEIFESLDKQINWRGRTLKCVQGAIVHVLAPAYGNFIGIYEVSYICDCTQEQVKSAVKAIKAYVNIKFNYTEALRKISNEFHIDFNIFKDFQPQPMNCSPPTDIYTYVISKVPEISKDLKVYIFKI